MKYTYLINQGSIVEHGFGDSTDLIDWALIDYVMKWQITPKATRIDDYVWIDYKQAIKDNPMLGLKTKASMSKRFNKLLELDLIECVKDNFKRAYFKITQKTSDIVSFRCSKPQETRVNHGKQAVNSGKKPVNEGLHITNQHLTDQYKKTKEKQPQKTPQKPKSTETWNAYSRAYLQRYDVAPLRGAKVNSLLCQFVDVVGIEQAPLVAAYYVQLTDQWYQKKSHDIPTLVQNAQAIFTQWARGTNNTSLDYRNQERQTGMASKVDAIKQKIQHRNQQ